MNSKELREKFEKWYFGFESPKYPLAMQIFYWIEDNILKELETSNTVSPPIPEWVIKYDQANHQSSAGKAIRLLMERLKVPVESPSPSLSDAQLEEKAKEILDKAYEPGMHWKIVNRKKVIAAMIEMYKENGPGGR